MKNQKPLIRRTFLQERFDILIKKQRNGNATFNDLTELDDIVNRDPAIRESILEEMQADNHPPHDTRADKIVLNEPVKSQTLIQKIKDFFNKVLSFEVETSFNPVL
jgi:hypothetical protein